MTKETFTQIALVLRPVALPAIWVLLMWFGLDAIKNHDGAPLVVYVVAGSTGIVVAIWAIWKVPKA
jgi:hypothetical protein